MILPGKNARLRAGAGSSLMRLVTFWDFVSFNCQARNVTIPHLMVLLKPAVAPNDRAGCDDSPSPVPAYS